MSKTAIAGTAATRSAADIVADAVTAVGFDPTADYPSMTVGGALSASEADHATTADTLADDGASIVAAAVAAVGFDPSSYYPNLSVGGADAAVSAAGAAHATTADTATNADHAGTADSATNATNADFATNAAGAIGAEYANVADIAYRLDGTQGSSQAATGVSTGENELTVDGVITLLPRSAPAAPSTGLRLYCDVAGNLHVLHANGTDVVISTP